MRRYFLILIYIVPLPLFAQWVQMPFPNTQPISSIAFSNRDTGYAVTPVALYRTTDGGQSWSIRSTPPGFHRFYTVSVPKFGSKQFVYAGGGYLFFDFGTQQQEVRSIFLRSTDFGETWTQTIDAPGIGPAEIAYCYFVTPTVGFIMGNGGPFIDTRTLKKTTNGGQIWTTPQAGSFSVWEGGNIDFVSDSVGFVQDGNNALRSTTNQGDNWTLLNFISILRVSFLSRNFGYGIFSRATKTTDGGLTFRPMRDSVIVNPWDILFVDSLTGYIASQQGQIYKTTNGDLWLPQVSPTTSFLTQIVAVSPTMLYISGNNGVILKTTNGGTAFVRADKDTRPATFSLEQNYPNPFNPSTIIKYQVSEAQTVRLEVFDLLGRNVATLVNERQSRGSYTYSFLPATYQLTSGTYFYRLQAGSFSQTRKMIFLK
jgi:photosystem II stability/assembly factor-like uncharacterized protein